MPSGAFVARRNGRIFVTGNSGFPKSLAIDKAIDKKRQEDSEAIRNVACQLRNALNQSGKTRAEIDNYFGTANVSQYWFSPDRNPQVPPVDRWPWLREFLNVGDELDAEIWRLNGRKGKPGEAWYEREVVGRGTAGLTAGTIANFAGEKEFDITAPATDAAKQWQGWGTALKPAVEIIVMARKPLIGTVAANVQAWGCGGLNIDQCRIAHGDDVDLLARQKNFDRMGYMGAVDTNGVATYKPQGRWPANLLLDPEAAALLDEQSGERKSGGGDKHGRKSSTFCVSTDWEQFKGTSIGGDTGGASRFFYVAKASKRDRDEGLEGMEERVGKRTQAGGDDTRGRPLPINANHHPTVKPTALCRWLVRLVTPPGGTVLDPFMGSGSTLKAAVLEGFNGVGIELDAEYLEIARRRIEHAQGQAAQQRAHLPQLPLLEMTGD